MLVITMNPTIDLNAKRDEKTDDLFKCAEKMEQGIFEQANTDSQYCKMLVEKVKSVSEAQ